MLEFFLIPLMSFFFSFLPCLIALVVFAVIVYIWLKNRESEKKLERNMRKSKDNL